MFKLPKIEWNEKTFATLIGFVALVLACLGMLYFMTVLAFLGLLLGVVAVVMASNLHKNQIRASGAMTFGALAIIIAILALTF